MSKYTTSVRNWCEAKYHEQEGGGLESPSVETVIRYARPFLFDFSYPIFDVRYQEQVESNIIRHFYFREIGFETFGMFKVKLHDKMVTVMPSINEMYESIIIDGNKIFDFSDGGEKRAFEEETSGENSKETSGAYEKDETTADKQNIEISDSETNKRGENDTPQNATQPNGWTLNGYLSGYTYEDNTHTQTRRVTNIEADSQGKINNGALFHWDHGTNSGTESGSNSGTRNYLETIYKIGDSHKNYEFLLEMENKLVSVETVLFESLESLFMQIW